MSQVGGERLVQKSLVSAALVLGGFVLGIVAMRAVDGRNLDGASAEVSDVVFPAAALKPWFRPVSEYDTGGQPLDDESFGTLMTALDDALTAQETLSDFGQEGDIHLWNFVRRLVRPEVTEAQRERIAAYMEGLQERHPDHHNMIAHHAASVALLFADAMPTTPAFTMTPGMSHVTHPSIFVDSALTGGQFTDAHVDALVRWIGTALTMPETANEFSQEAGRYFGELGRILQRAQLTDRQDERVFAALEEIKASNAEFGETMDREVDKLRRFIPGGIPPNIVRMTPRESNSPWKTIGGTSWFSSSRDTGAGPAGWNTRITASCSSCTRASQSCCSESTAMPNSRRFGKRRSTKDWTTEPGGMDTRPFRPRVRSPLPGTC